MAESPDDPPFAAPLSYAPPARPVSIRFPELPIGRLEAAVDLAILVPLLAVLQISFSLSGLLDVLLERWPQVGILWANVALGVFSLTVVAVVVVFRRQSPVYLGLNRLSGGRLLLASAAAVPACYLASLMGFLLYTTVAGFDTEAVIEEKGQMLEIVQGLPVAWMLPFSLFVGLHEEILFRGFLLSRVRALFHSNAAAIIVTSLVFGCLHSYQGLMGVFQTAAIGLVLAAIVTYARSLWPAIIAHAAFDAISMLAAPWLMDVMEELSEQLDTAPALAAW